MAQLNKIDTDKTGGKNAKMDSMPEFQYVQRPFKQDVGADYAKDYNGPPVKKLAYLLPEKTHIDAVAQAKEWQRKAEEGKERRRLEDAPKVPPPPINGGRSFDFDI